MLSLAVLTSNPVAADGIEQLTQEAGVFKLVFKGTPIPATPIVIRTLRVHNPDLVLLDLGDWEAVTALARQITQANLGATVIGFRPSWNRLEQITFEEAGIVDLLHEPFSPSELETAAYEALHRNHPLTNQNILAFLPAKAGSGCSTVALNTAGALANHISKTVLLIESDRRSGVLSIMLNLQHRQGLSEALQHAGEITPVEWQQYCAAVFGMHLLLANPTRRGPLPSWADYYQLLRYVQRQYDFLIVDLPEVVNEATAEVVKSSRGIFVVCTPEIPSLKMASLRCSELQECEILPGQVHIVLNRWERGKLSIQDIEGILERPVFGTLPNDHAHVKDAILESRLVSRDSAFAEGCLAFARKLSGLPEKPPEQSKFALLKRLGRITG